MDRISTNFIKISNVAVTQKTTMVHAITKHSCIYIFSFCKTRPKKVSWLRLKTGPDHNIPIVTTWWTISSWPRTTLCFWTILPSRLSGKVTHSWNLMSEILPFNEEDDNDNDDDQEEKNASDDASDHTNVCVRCWKREHKVRIVCDVMLNVANVDVLFN